MTAVSEIMMTKNEIMPPYEKTQDFPEKCPETQTRRKNLNLVETPRCGNTVHDLDDAWIFPSGVLNHHITTVEPLSCSK